MLPCAPVAQWSLLSNADRAAGRSSEVERRTIDIHIVKDLRQGLVEGAAAADVPKEPFRQWGFRGGGVRSPSGPKNDSAPHLAEAR